MKQKENVQQCVLMIKLHPKLFKRLENYCDSIGIKTEDYITVKFAEWINDGLEEE